MVFITVGAGSSIVQSSSSEPIASSSCEDSMLILWLSLFTSTSGASALDDKVETLGTSTASERSLSLSEVERSEFGNISEGEDRCPLEKLRLEVVEEAGRYIRLLAESKELLALFDVEKSQALSALRTGRNSLCDPDFDSQWQYILTNEA